MKSIRGRITTWLLAGLAILWVAGGTAIYMTSRTAMLARIDTENQGLARQVRFLSRGGGPGRWQREDVANTHGLIAPGVYYEVWNADGEVVLRSENLDERNLPQVAVAGEETVFKTVEISPGERIRLAATQFAAGRAGRGPHGGGGGGGGGMNEPVVVVVARNLAGLESESRNLLWWLGGIGLLAAGGTYLLLALALRDGLRPLHDLGEAVAGVDASSLHARFGAGEMPRELQPIVERLDALMQRLETGFQRERRFGSDLAHELRTPIAEIRAMAELSLKWPAERTEQQMHDIRGVTQRMENVVNTLLQLARLEGGGEPPERKAIDLGELLTELWQPHVPLAEQRGLSAQFEWPRNATMPGNPELWRHLLGNLLSNAAEYATSGGTVLVERGTGSIRIVNPVDGLEAGQVEQMFERFWRADPSRTGEVHSGLGLSLAKACAEAMGLQISATLETGSKGESFMAIEVREAAGINP
jgi:signal transduction histidine kinase